MMCGHICAISLIISYMEGKFEKCLCLLNVCIRLEGIEKRNSFRKPCSERSTRFVFPGHLTSMIQTTAGESGSNDVIFSIDFDKIKSICSLYICTSSYSLFCEATRITRVYISDNARSYGAGDRFALLSFLAWK